MASIIISLDDTKEIAKSWIDSHSYDFTEWGWETGTIFDMYNDFNGGSYNIPQNFIIDADGNVRGAFIVITNPIQETQIIDELI